MTVRDPFALECREVVELLTEFLEGALAPEDRARLEQHLLVCPPCTQYLGQLRSTISQLGDLRAVPGPVAVAPAVLDAFRQWKRKGGGGEGA